MTRIGRRRRHAIPYRQRVPNAHRRQIVADRLGRLAADRRNRRRALRAVELVGAVEDPCDCQYKAMKNFVIELHALKFIAQNPASYNLLQIFHIVIHFPKCGLQMRESSFLCVLFLLEYNLLSRSLKMH